MISLKESILSSTGSGKNKKIDVPYILSIGFRLEDTSISHDTYILDKWARVLHTYKKFPGKIIYRTTMRKGKHIDFKYYILETIYDLDLVMDFWNKIETKYFGAAVGSGKQEEERQHKIEKYEIEFTNKLKEIKL